MPRTAWGPRWRCFGEHCRGKEQRSDAGHRRLRHDRRRTGGAARRRRRAGALPAAPLERPLTARGSRGGGGVRRPERSGRHRRCGGRGVPRVPRRRLSARRVTVQRRRGLCPLPCGQRRPHRPPAGRQRGCRSRAVSVRQYRRRLRTRGRCPGRRRQPHRAVLRLRPLQAGGRGTGARLRPPRPRYDHRTSQRHLRAGETGTSCLPRWRWRASVGSRWSTVGATWWTSAMSPTSCA